MCAVDVIMLLLSCFLLSCVCICTGFIIRNCVVVYGNVCLCVGCCVRYSNFPAGMNKVSSIYLSNGTNWRESSGDTLKYTSPVAGTEVWTCVLQLRDSLFTRCTWYLSMFY